MSAMNILYFTLSTINQKFLPQEKRSDFQESRNLAQMSLYSTRFWYNVPISNCDWCSKSMRNSQDMTLKQSSRTRPLEVWRMGS